MLLRSWMGGLKNGGVDDVSATNEICPGKPSIPPVIVVGMVSSV